jgi:polyisoprenoid-binding protein YceI
MNSGRAALAAITSLLCLGSSIAAAPNVRKMDASHSSLKIHVYKTGLFSGFAHNHEIQAPIESGEVKEPDDASVEVRVNVRKMRVLDPEESDGKRAEIQRTMQGPQVLDSDRFPEIRFQSTTVEPKEANRWVVHGNLDLHGQTHPVTVDVILKDGFYRGSTTLKQTVFGITPVSIAGGTVKVKDEIKVEFEISLVK